MLSIDQEQILSLAEAASRLPRRRGGKKPHVATLYRWADAGCRGVVLETVQIGGTRCTSVEALDRFFQRLTQGRTAVEEPKRPRRWAGRRGQESIDDELDGEGL